MHVPMQIHQWLMAHLPAIKAMEFAVPLKVIISWNRVINGNPQLDSVLQALPAGQHSFQQQHILKPLQQEVWHGKLHYDA